ncbi:MAG: hypothetical protein QNJ73_09730 [Gammaproteobacteria bacterium]|nr:hypothetical protein [Gammaproteobacteria bacterium]
MRTRRRNYLIATVLLLFARAVDARTTTLMTWADQELAPYVVSQLTEHPRFKGETVVFVALQDGAPAPITNALVLELRDRLVNAVIDEPAVTIGWQTDHVGRDGPAIDCTRDIVHYYIGLEVDRLIDDRHRVTLRVLDATDRSWVTGTSQSWEGRLTRAQKKAFSQSMTDEYFRGSREVPFSPTQTDLLAARLAHELTCNLLRQVGGEYVIAADSASERSAQLAGALELVRNNLAGNPALQITTNSGVANATLVGKAHPIAGDLHQYWVTITPTGTATELPAISASTYVRLPYSARVPVAAANPGPASAPLPVSAPNNDLITPLYVVEPRQRSSCYRRGWPSRKVRVVGSDHTIARGECFWLQTRPERDVAMFLLNYQVIHGLVSLTGRRCGNSSAWLDARADKTLQFPAPDDDRVSASAWQGHAGLESFYAIAVSNDRAARELAVLVEQLPTRCALSATQGLSGSALEAWLARLGSFNNRWQHAVDWQAVRVEHVY